MLAESEDREREGQGKRWEGGARESRVGVGMAGSRVKMRVGGKPDVAARGFACGSCEG